MRHVSLLTTCLCALLCVASAVAGPITDSIAFQGQLNDGSGNPVADGPQDLVLSIWTDSVGGSMLHSEIVAVTTSKGLFSTCVGCGSSTFPDIFTTETLFLQTQVSGQPPMEPRTRLRRVPFAMSATSLHSETTTSGAKARGIIINKPATVNPRGKVSLTFDFDDDGDGVTENESALSSGQEKSSVSVKSSRKRYNLADTFPQSWRIDAHDSDSASHVSMVLESDLNIDGAAESRIAQTTDTAGATQRIEKKGINAVNVKLAITGSVEGDEARHSLTEDSDDDGLPDQEISSSLIPTRAQHAVNTKGTGAQNGRSTSVSSTTEVDSATTEVLGLDGTTEGRVRLSAQPSGQTVVSVSSVDASSGTPIIKGSALMTSSSTGVLHRLQWDADGDGVSDRTITEDCDDGDAGIAIQAGVAVPKFLDITTKAQASADRADVGMVMGVGADTAINIGCDDDDAGVTIQAGVAIPKFLDITAKAQSAAHQADVGLVMGTGSDTAMHLGCDDSSTRISVVPPTAGTYEFQLVVTDNSGLLSMTNSAGTISLQLDGDGRLGIGGPAHASDPIHHSSSGAHLTSGGVWTNASDANAKENFSPVNGEDLLEKLAQLPISQWNYRNESAEITHIGPTAQDFQRVFGVGENDKTISTIDPSGIALAAIKELTRKNEKLEAANRDLRKDLEELRSLVQRITSNK